MTALILGICFSFLVSTSNSDEIAILAGVEFDYERIKAIGLLDFEQAVAKVREDGIDIVIAEGSPPRDQPTLAQRLNHQVSDQQIRRFYVHYIENVLRGNGLFIPPHKKLPFIPDEFNRPGVDRSIILINSSSPQMALIQAYTQALIYRSRTSRKVIRENEESLKLVDLEKQRKVSLLETWLHEKDSEEYRSAIRNLADRQLAYWDSLLQRESIYSTFENLDALFLILRDQSKFRVGQGDEPLSRKDMFIYFAEFEDLASMIDWKAVNQVADEFSNDREMAQRIQDFKTNVLEIRFRLIAFFDLCESEAAIGPFNNFRNGSKFLMATKKFEE